MDRHDLFIAARILNFGDWKAVSWLQSHGGKALIQRTVKNRRDLNAKTINFWNIVLFDKKRSPKPVSKKMERTNL